MSKQRSFSPQFRLQVVQQIVRGQKSRAQGCREYELAPRVVGRRKEAYLQEGEQAFGTRRATADELSVQRRLSELERLCGRLALETEVVKKALGKPGQLSKAESFFKTVKVEEVSVPPYQSMEEAQAHLAHFLDEVYHQKRLPSSLGYRPPAEFQAQFYVLS